MSGWPDVVTTALLGTGRRPVPGLTESGWAAAVGPVSRTDPAQRVLDLAAAHAATARLSSVRGCPAAPRGPVQSRPVAPATACELLTELLQRPEPAMINFWLQACARHGYGLPAEHWTAVARLAVRSGRYDRDLLARTLGERGRWFIEQNPDWHRLAANLTERTSALPAAGEPEPSRIDPDALEVVPESIFDHPDPWPDALVAAAFRALGTGRLGNRWRSFAVGVGVRLPPRTYVRIGSAAEYYLYAPDATPAARRSVRAAFVALEQAAHARMRVDRAFDETLPAIARIDIPAV